MRNTDNFVISYSPKLARVTLILAFVFAIFTWLSFSMNQIGSGIVGCLQVALLIASYLMGKEVFRFKYNSLYILPAILAVLLVLSFMKLYGKSSGRSKLEKLSWPTTGLATKLPEPDAKYGDVMINDSESLYVNIDSFSQSKYDTYLAACKLIGYTIDAEVDSYGYEAYNSEGYHLDISYYSSLMEMKIDLDAPIVMNDFNWTSYVAAQLIPMPKSYLGKVVTDKSTKFSAYIGSTTFEDYEEYLDKCMKFGFSLDYDKGDDYYRAYNSEGYKLSVSYEGFNTMYVSIDAEVEEE